MEPLDVLELIDRSAMKWESIGAGIGLDAGPRNCALCSVFFECGCNGCPVKKYSGFDCCTNTPYDDWLFHMQIDHERWSDMPYFALCPECRRLAKLERSYLWQVRQWYINNYCPWYQ